MSKTLQQIFATNPITSNIATDLMYFVQSPYTPGTDAGMTFANFAAQFVSSTAIVNPAHGGTGVNNGTNTLTLGGNTAFSGAFTFTGTLTGNTAVTFPTTGTLATTSQLLISPLNTKGDIWVWSTTNDRLPVAVGDGKILQVSSGAATGLAYSTPTYPSASGALGKFLISDGTNNVYSTSTIPTSAGATANKVLLSDGTNYVLSTPTFPNASATLNKIIKSDGTNWIASTETYAVPGTSGNVMTSDGTNWVSSPAAGVTLLTTKGDLFGFSTVNARVPVAVGDGKVLQVSSAAAVGLAYSTATYPVTATGTGTLLRADGTNWVATTSTYPNTNAINTLLYASAANVMSALATANNGLLVTSATGVPSILAGPGTTGNMLLSNAAAAPSFSTSTIPSSAGATAGKVLLSDGTNYVLSTPTFPNASATAGKFIRSDGTNWIASTPTLPTTAGTSGKILISDGTNWVSSTPTYPNTSPAAGLFIVSDGTNFVASAKPAFTTINVQVFVASGTYTPTSGMKYCIIEALGQGGGGGGVASSSGCGSGGGGGAGSYARKFATAATVGASQTVTIANTGGGGGAAGNNPGTAGSDASLGTICVGKGGTGGGGAAANGAGAGGSGGVAGTGDFTPVGNAGGAGMGGSISTLAIITGRGAASVLGGSPAQKVGNVSATGAAAANYGAGGDGGCSFAGGAAGAGGAGSGGIVIVTEFIYA